MRTRSLKRALFLLCVPLLALASSHRWVFGEWRRISTQPIMSPGGEGWESVGTFNPAGTLHKGKIVMLYRAQDKAGTSRLGYAESSDGLQFTRLPNPVLSPETNYEAGGGIEDPRLVKVGDTYYLTYTRYNRKDAQLNVEFSSQ
jgi:beta-1,2-mannosidase